MMTYSFTDLMKSLVEGFGSLYTTGELLWRFFSTPLVEASPGIESFIGDLAYSTSFELMFGAGLIGVLVVALINFFVGIL